ncbi:MAG: single-stranded DNA-binding protein [Syntrophobacterales bacterium]|nr:single-stranded DNA-binding protein [Syntrophobacterales bacterium]
MNKVFLTGRLKVKPEVFYTPKGEKIVQFPLWVEDDAFSIDVVYPERQGTRDLARLKGSVVTVSGALMKAMDGHGAIKLKANKIIWMEE